MTVADVAAAARRNQVPRGIAYMVGSTVMFAGGNAVVKWQLASYPLGEVAFGRTLFSLLTVAAIVLPRTGWGVLRTQRYREHLQRGLSQFGSMLCWFLAAGPRRSGAGIRGAQDDQRLGRALRSEQLRQQRDSGPVGRRPGALNSVFRADSGRWRDGDEAAGLDPNAPVWNST